MIYNNSFFKKELRESYFENAISSKSRIGFAVFVALSSFAVHFILITLTTTVLAETIPQFTERSYYSVLLIYINVSYFYYLIYLVSNFRFLTFAEIKSNKWYILMKFGFSPVRMIFTKLYVRLVSVFFIYGLGFFFTLFLTSILKYPLVWENILPLFILGLFDIFFVIVVTMTSSLFFENGSLSGYITVVCVIVLAALKYITGYYNIIENRKLFVNITVLYLFIKYFVILLGTIIICLVIILVRAKFNARYFYFSFYKKDLDFPENVRIVIPSAPYNERRAVNEYSVKTKTKIISGITNSLLILVIFSSILFNVMVLFVSLSTPGNEIGFVHIIPYVFKSDTMEPAIVYNDLVFFRTIENKDMLTKGDIILYQANGEINVARIQSFQSGKVVVDIDNYPARENGSYLRETIDRSGIYARYAGRSRWLGVLVLFANTTFGRMTLLLIPSLLLFYYKPIIEFSRFITFERQKEE
jgi:hypothetical protein